MCKQQVKYYDVLLEFSTVAKIALNYGEAWREKGVLEGMITRELPKKAPKKLAWMPEGYDSPARAI